MQAGVQTGSGEDRPASLTLGQGDKPGIPRNHLEPGRFPVGLRRLDAVLAGGNEVPPDIAWTVHGGAPEHHKMRLGHGLYGDAVAGTEDQKPARLEPVALDLDLA